MAKEHNRDQVDGSVSSDSVAEDDQQAGRPTPPRPSTDEKNPKTASQIEADLLIEDRFEATDN